MVVQGRNYLRDKKKKHLIQLSIWGSLVFFTAVIGIVATGSRNNYFTVGAGLLIIPFAMHATQILTLLKYKDADPTYALQLEAMSGSYALFHSCILPDQRTTLFVQHIVITSRGIYSLDTDSERIQKVESLLKPRLVNKGIAEERMLFIHIKDRNTLEEIISKIEKETCFSDEQLGNTKNIVDAMIM